ncbi:hypothetical protein SLE2022_288070 [Rubroshorea leprosula]
MLCSISTGKSGSNWLERLRSNKGFPSGDNLDLGNFLSNPNSSDSPITNASDSPNSSADTAQSNDIPVENLKPVARERPSETGDKEWLGIMSNVLSELFNMGDRSQSSRFPAKKSSRKQRNPKICITQSSSNGVNMAEEERSGSDCVRRGENILPVKSTLNLGEKRKEAKEESDNNGEARDAEDEPEKGESELVGFSKSEVTVIDTSCGVWKFDKLVFRRKNIWKVRDKKGKSRNFGRKRKGSTFDGNADGNAVCNKKQKIASSELSTLNDASGREYASISTHGSNPEDDKSEQVCIERPSDLNQVPRKRLSRKSRKRRSSVILIKAIPTS